MSTTKPATSAKANTYEIKKNGEIFHIERAVMYYCSIGEFRRQTLSFSPPMEAMYRLRIRIAFNYSTPAGTYNFEAGSPASASILEEKKIGLIWVGRGISISSGSVSLTTADPIEQIMEGSFEFDVKLYEQNDPLKFGGVFYFDGSSCTWEALPK